MSAVWIENTSLAHRATNVIRRLSGLFNVHLAQRSLSKLKVIGGRIVLGRSGLRSISSVSMGRVKSWSATRYPIQRSGPEVMGSC